MSSVATGKTTSKLFLEYSKINYTILKTTLKMTKLFSVQLLKSVINGFNKYIITRTKSIKTHLVTFIKITFHPS